MGTRTKSGTSPQVRVLADVEPWWNPPWPMRWQYAYHHARTHPHTSRATRWITAQGQAWPLLHPGQQELLAALGISVGRQLSFQRGRSCSL
ncbi:hypothetical protein KEF29_10820 [Streptomyces tuirus]|uniref:Uncharacterized protein n=1 Tax=Streptomyces tuirus TaxID=68278 RepID=A0A941FA94_9ACTN|nr:hypothetical protein [Streptomyces tuirus]